MILVSIKENIFKQNYVLARKLQLLKFRDYLSSDGFPRENIYCIFTYLQKDRQGELLKQLCFIKEILHVTVF